MDSNTEGAQTLRLTSVDNKDGSEEHALLQLELWPQDGLALPYTNAAAGAPAQGGSSIATPLVAAGVHGKAYQTVLTGRDAVEIYLAKPEKGRHDASFLAVRFNVTAKTIRDIWRRRTWWRATRHLWTPEERAEHLQSLLCNTCSAREVDSATTACTACAAQIHKILGTLPVVTPMGQSSGGSSSGSSEVATSSTVSASFDWDILPVEPTLPAECDLARACATSREQALANFPHTQLFEDVHFDKGWMMDHRMLAFFIANSVDESQGAGRAEVGTETRRVRSRGLRMTTMPRPAQ